MYAGNDATDFSHLESCYRQMQCVTKRYHLISRYFIAFKHQFIPVATDKFHCFLLLIQLVCVFSSLDLQKEILNSQHIHNINNFNAGTNWHSMRKRQACQRTRHCSCRVYCNAIQKEYTHYNENMKQMDSVYGISLAVIYRDKLLILFVGFLFSQANSCRQQRLQYQIHCSEQIIQILVFGVLSRNVLLNCKTLTIVRLIIFIK